MSSQGLGKDFSALIPDDMLSEALAVGSLGDHVEQLPTSRLKPDPQQPRKHFDEHALNELAQSIKQFGVVQPLIVAKKGGDYIIIAGERRYRAAQSAGITSVPAIVRSFSKQEKLEVSLIENIQREDLTKLELAAAYLKLHNQFNMSYKDIGSRVGKAPSTVLNIIRLLKLPKQAKIALNEDLIVEGHARQIITLETEEEQLKLLELILKNHWTVRQAEQYIVGHREATVEEKGVDEGLKRTQSETNETKRLSERLNAHVVVKQMARGGQLVIKYTDDEHLEKLMSDLLA